MMQRNLIRCWWGHTMCSCSERGWQFLTKLNTPSPGGPAIILLGIYPREMKTYIHMKSCMVFTAVLFTIAKKLEITQTSFNRWVDKQAVAQKIKLKKNLIATNISHTHIHTYRHTHTHTHKASSGPSHHGTLFSNKKEIGRASCRERV